MRWSGWLAGLFIAVAVLNMIPGDQGATTAFMLGGGCALLGYLIGMGAES